MTISIKELADALDEVDRCPESEPRKVLVKGILEFARLEKQFNELKDELNAKEDALNKARKTISRAYNEMLAMLVGGKVKISDQLLADMAKFK